MRGDGEFLVNHRHAGTRPASGSRRVVRDAVEKHFTAVGGAGAAEHLHKRALAGAVFTDECENLPALQIEIDGFERTVGPNRRWTPHPQKQIVHHFSSVTALISGESTLSLVTTAVAVGTLPGTVSPLRWATIVCTPR